MNLPSVNTLLRVTDGDRDVAKLARKVLESSRTIYAKLNALNALLDAHGVEAGPFPDGEFWPEFEYINMGDSYVDTITNTHGRFRVECLASATGE